jgi:hypothetical protein
MALLGTALLNLNKGTVHPLLQPAPIRNRPPDTTEFWLGRARVAAGFYILLKSGLTRKEAKREIERHRHLQPLKSKKTDRHGSLGSAAESWFEQLKEGTVSDKVALQTFAGAVTLIDEKIAQGLTTEHLREFARRYLEVPRVQSPS